MKPAAVLLLLPMPSAACASTARATVRSSRQRIWLWWSGWRGKGEMRVSLAEEEKRIGETDKAGTTSQQQFCPQQYYYQKDHHNHTTSTHDAALRRNPFGKSAALPFN
jgi:hypothetical protein